MYTKFRWVRTLQKLLHMKIYSTNFFLDDYSIQRTATQSAHNTQADYHIPYMYMCIQQRIFPVLSEIAKATHYM